MEKTKYLAEKFINKHSKLINANCCIGRIFSFTDCRQKPPFLIPSIKKKLSSKKQLI